MIEPLKSVQLTRHENASTQSQLRTIPEETPIAFVYDGATHAVMMATPADLEDFAMGFSLSEGKIGDPDDITELDIVTQQNGIELRMWLTPQAGHRIATRRRALLGPTGCGLCGVESIDAALPELPLVVARRKFLPSDIEEALSALAPAQVMNASARALHAAAFWQPCERTILLREDVGRHNALDKLAGALTRASIAPTSGIVVVTSRLSVEMVQKTAVLGAPLIVAVSVPTALALRTAQECGITVVAVARGDSFEVFTHPHRLADEPAGQGRFNSKVELHAVV